MLNSPLKKDSVLITSVNDVRMICAPLIEHFGIDNFKYLKILPDMSRVHLGMNPKWCEFFYANIERYQKKNLTGGHHWSSGHSRLFALGDACIDDAIAHDVGDGIVLARRDEASNCTEMFFATYKWSQSTDVKVDMLMRNIDMLDLFSTYFKQAAKNIIARAEQDPIRLPFIKKKTEIRAFPSDDAIRQAFTVDLNKLMSKDKFSAREVECIYFTSLDMSAKQVARQLTISPKTVENHLENAKNKLGYSKKSSLLKHLIGCL